MYLRYHRSNVFAAKAARQPRLGLSLLFGILLRRLKPTATQCRPVRGRAFWSACLVAVVVFSISLGLVHTWLEAADTETDQHATVLGKVVPLPDTVVEVQSPATGRILSPRERPYTVGDIVKKGDPLAIIEHRYNLHDASHLSAGRWDYLRDMLDARVAWVEAKLEREKAERLLQLGSVSGQQVQSLRAAEAIAEAEYKKRKILLDQQDSQLQAADLVRRGIFSPIDGVISFVSFTQGQTINEGVLLLRVANRKQVGFSARFPESDFLSLKAKAAARIHFDSLPDQVFTGRLELVSPAVDPESRTRDVLFRVENLGEYLRYGMIGWLELESK